MNKFNMTMMAALMCMSTAAFAQDSMKHDSMKHDSMKQDSMKHDSMKNDADMKPDMMAMDANGDGMISKDEYMKSTGATAAHWAAMKKDKDGMVSMKNMQMEHDKMMKNGGMMKSDGMMKKDGGDH